MMKQKKKGETIRDTKRKAQAAEKKTQWAPAIVGGSTADTTGGHNWTPPCVLIIIITQTIASDVGERGRGDEAHSERAREVVVLAAALVAEVKRVLLLPLVGVAEHDHLTQEGVHDHVLVVDLLAAHGRKAEIRKWKEREAWKEKKDKTKGNKQSQKRKPEEKIHEGQKLKLIEGRWGTERNKRCWCKGVFRWSNKWKILKLLYIAYFKENELT